MSGSDPARTEIPKFGHIPALDGLRGLAILMVMVIHQAGLVPKSALDRAVLMVLPLGEAGVDLFFVLSGFLITGILVASKGAPHYYRNFYARRFLRIFPLYYAVLFAVFFVLPHLVPSPQSKWGHVSGPNQLWYWAYLSNWYIALKTRGPTHGVVDLSWTLSIEEQFYLTWPMVVALSSRRTLLAICAGLIASGPAFRLTMVAIGAADNWSHFLTPLAVRRAGRGGWPGAAGPGWSGSLEAGAGGAGGAGGRTGVHPGTAGMAWVVVAAPGNGGRTGGAGGAVRVAAGPGHLGAAGFARTPALRQLGVGGSGPVQLCPILLPQSDPGGAPGPGDVPAGPGEAGAGEAGRPGGVLRVSLVGGASPGLGQLASFRGAHLAPQAILPLGPDPPGRGRSGCRGRPGRGIMMSSEPASRGGDLRVCHLGKYYPPSSAWVSWRVFEEPILRLKRFFPSGQTRPAEAVVGVGGGRAEES